MTYSSLRKNSRYDYITDVLPQHQQSQILSIETGAFVPKQREKACAHSYTDKRLIQRRQKEERCVPNCHY